MSGKILNGKQIEYYDNNVGSLSSRVGLRKKVKKKLRGFQHLIS